jgi:hypothetical protein
MNKSVGKYFPEIKTSRFQEILIGLTILPSPIINLVDAGTRSMV